MVQYSQVYFLCVLVLECMPRISISNGIPYISIPLTIIVLASLARAVYQQHKRETLQIEENTSLVNVLKENVLTTIESQSLCPGDLVALRFNELAKCDLLLLSSDQNVFIETALLDGESSLKPKRTLNLSLQERDSLRVDLAAPTENLYKVQGWVHGLQHPLILQNVVLRGSRMKSEGLTVGMVLYSGMQTKQMLNMTHAASHKSSRMQRVMFYLLVLLIALMLLLSLILSVINDLRKQRKVNFIVELLGWCLKFSRIVPVSLIVSMEFIKFFQGQVLEQDSRLHCQTNNFQAKFQRTPVLQNLGQVQIILSDKTGTITCNEMTVFSVQPLRGCQDDIILAMNCCHSVLVVKNKEEIIYNGTSAQEVASLKYNAAAGQSYLGRVGRQILLLIHNQVVEVTVLEVLPYQEERKSMSILVELRGQKIILSKGADDYFQSRLAESSGRGLNKVLLQSRELAEKGLRTLCYASKIVSEEQAHLIAKATTSNNSSLLQQVWDQACSGMKLLGIVAFQDKLQRNVVPTIISFRKAGISFWMITGDKVETALEIGRFIGMFQGRKKVVRIQSKTFKVEQGASSSFVIDGRVVAEMSDEELAQFVDCAKHSSVVVARVSPSQKARICTAAKATCLVLAVGDGSNDVGMIFEADVGVGMKGRQNSQAMQSADVTIGQFQQLGTLILHHGRQLYRKNGEAVLFLLHKNYLMVVPLFLFAFFSKYSGAFIYDQINSQFYSVVYTSLPIILLTIFDYQLTSSESMNALYRYREGHEKKHLNFKLLLLDLLWGFFASFTVLLVPLVLGQDTVKEGFYLPAPTQYLMVFFLIIVNTNLKIFLFSHRLCWGLLLSVLLGIGSFLAVTPVLQAITNNSFSSAQSLMLFLPSSLLSQVVFIAVEGQLRVFFLELLN